MTQLTVVKDAAKEDEDGGELTGLFKLREEVEREILRFRDPKFRPKTLDELNAFVEGTLLGLIKEQAHYLHETGAIVLDHDEAIERLEDGEDGGAGLSEEDITHLTRVVDYAGMIAKHSLEQGGAKLDSTQKKTLGEVLESVEHWKKRIEEIEAEDEEEDE